MTKEEKIKIRLLQILEMINEEEIETVEIPATAGFLVKSHDEPEEMTWHEAMEKFGPEGSDKEWRLPTQLELDIVCENKDKIPNLNEDEYYWSSRAYNDTFAYAMIFSRGHPNTNGKHNNYLVRCVKR